MKGVLPKLIRARLDRAEIKLRKNCRDNEKILAEIRDINLTMRVKKTTLISIEKYRQVIGCIRRKHDSVKEQGKLTGVVAGRCTCKAVEVLWDTGARVSIVSAK